MPDRPGYSFGDGAPREVSEFLRRKDWRPAFSWESVEPAEHAVAFTVAKATSMDVLETIRDAVQEAIDDGVPFERFRQQLQPVLEAKGWWGRRDVVDPDTGETVSAQLGSPRRLRVIYQANLRSARAAGQWERIQRAKRGLPFLLYQLGPSERRRPHHASKEGWVLPVDDPFWEKWMPPNGWGCKCHVRQISRSEAERRGLIDAPKIPDVEVENSRTGEVRRVPQGIDPGWDTNPGLERSRADGLRLAEKIAAAPPEMARAMTRDARESWAFQRVRNGEAGFIPVAVVPQRVTAALRTGPKTAILSGETARKLDARRRADQPFDVLEDLEAALPSAPARLDAPTRATVHFLSGERTWRAGLKLTRAGELLITTLFPASPRQIRRFGDQGTGIE